MIYETPTNMETESKKSENARNVITTINYSVSLLLDALCVLVCTPVVLSLTALWSSYNVVILG